MLANQPCCDALAAASAAVMDFGAHLCELLLDLCIEQHTDVNIDIDGDPCRLMAVLTLCISWTVS